MQSVMGSKQMTWCVWKSFRYKLSHYPCRWLFSETGHWDRDYNQDIRRELEYHWKPKLQAREVMHQKLQPENEKQKYYVLSMFPYPSGKLHMGHVRVYTISDTMARYQRLMGKEVIHPMGWDAFGLPAENAAIERGEKPDKWTHSNISSMKKQLEELGCSFDWHREFATCDPEYYRWTQFIFLKMYEAGLVYQQEAEVNWDPVDQTVLADEQISEDGLSWRSGAKVEKRYLRQWYIKTTAYAKSLLDGLQEVNSDLWKDIILLQKNWIGNCNGCRIEFTVKMDKGEYLDDPLSVFTTCPEAVYGVSHLALSPDHRLNDSRYYKNGQDSSATEITLTLQAVHPFTKECFPIMVSRTTDFDEFTDMHLGIPSVSEADKVLAERMRFKWIEALTDEGEKQTVINSQQFSGLDRKTAFGAVLEHLQTLNIGGHPVSSKLRDWLISRQRYWGTPIPVIHCPSCKSVPVPFDQLPVKLPEVHHLSARGASPLIQDSVWHSVTCPKCKGPATRETDTMDTFVDSSWYFLRYLDPQNKTAPFDPAVSNRFMPVDLYIGGKEHAVLHLYFARFFSHFLHGLGLIPEREPFLNLLTQGMVMGRSYRVKGTGRYLRSEEVDFSGPKPVEKSSGIPVVVGWEKMSKSKYNGVDPEDVLTEFGVDSTRLCILSSVAPQSHRKWSSEAYKGILNWQNRIWTLVADFITTTQTGGDNSGVVHGNIEEWEEKLFEDRNYFLKEVTFHFQTTFLLSVAISRLQGLTNVLKKFPTSLMRQSIQFERSLADLIIMLAPFAPHFASELWTGFRTTASHIKSDYQLDEDVLDQQWPLVDQDYKLPLVVKVNGQDMSEIRIHRQELEILQAEAAHEHARQDAMYQQFCEGRPIKEIFFNIVPGYQAVINLIIPSTGDKKDKKKKQKKDKTDAASIEQNIRQ